jgi:AcrR family transcriptional regulator
MAEREPGENSQRGLPRLPPGRHGLPREFVVENQRQRIAAGMIQAIAKDGYVATSVAQVIAAAGVSRRTFYDYYRDKDDAFFDVYRQVTDFLGTAMVEAGASRRGGWGARVKAELAALLDCFGESPNLVRFCLVAPPAAGGDVAVAHRQFLEQLLKIFRDGRPKSAKRPPPASEYGAVGGLAALIVAANEDGGREAVEQLLPELTELILTPYLGREAAVRTSR